MIASARARTTPGTAGSATSRSTPSSDALMSAAVGAVAISSGEVGAGASSRPSTRSQKPICAG
ncbi:MAG: hypothetical protein QM779_03570 [Propionicimonas sp.]